MKKRNKILLALPVLLVGAGLWYLRAPTAPGDYIMTGGEIITMNPSQPRAEALRVTDGRISAVGDLTSLQAERGDLPVIDLAGATLTPGLIEPHTHPLASALLGAAVDVSGFTHQNRASVMAALRTAADGVALTPWLVAYGWDPVAVADLERPTLAELDEISPDRPMVILTQMMHEAYVNSAALKAAGLTLKDKAAPQDGFLRNKAGHLTGTVREIEAITRIVGHIPPAPEAAVELLLRRQYVRYAEAGYTTIGIAGAVGKHGDPVGLLRKIGDRPASPLRSYLYLLPDQVAGAELGGTTNFSILGIKYWMDGSPFTGGAALEDAYSSGKLTEGRLGIPAGHRGHVNYTAANFTAQVREAHKKGYQLAIHAQGEQAIEQALTALEEAQEAAPHPTLRHRLEHNALITQAQLKKARRLQVSTGFFVDHVYFYGDTLPRIVGEARMERYMPVKSAWDAGLVVTLHGDHPATPINALRTLQTAITRLSRSGRTVSGGTEALSAQQALRAMTLNAAHQLGQAATLGSVERGKQADFTIFSQNPLRVAPDELSTIKVLATWKSGIPTNRKMTTLAQLALVWDILIEKVFGE